MAKKITELTEAILADDNDYLTFVDIDATEIDELNKKITVKNLLSQVDNPYLKITSTDTFPSVLADDVIAIGENINVAEDSLDSIAIGKNSKIDFATGAIAIGLNSEISLNTTLPAAGAIAIGDTAKVESFNAISIGKKSLAHNDSSIVIGANAKDYNNSFGPQSDQAIVIGTQATIQAGSSDSIAIGSSSLINNASNSIAIGKTAFVNVAGNSSISIGTQATSNYFGSICIGAFGDANFDGAIALGNNASAANTDSIAIGRNAICSTLESIAIGGASSTTNSATVNSTGDGAIAIGWGTDVSGDEAIAIGRNADATAYRAVQLSAGTNSILNTLQFQNVTIANDQGIEVKTGTVIPSVAARNGTLYIHSTNNDFYFRSSDIWHKINNSSSSNPYIKINSTGQLPVASSDDGIAIGENANSTGGSVNIAIGRGALSQGSNGGSIAIGVSPVAETGSIALGLRSSSLHTNSIAIGSDSRATGGNSGNSIAIGTLANCSAENAISLGVSSNATALFAIQLGSGTNNNAYTIQYKNVTIANEQGIEVKTGTTPPSVTARDGTLYIDITALKLYFYANSQWIAVN